MLRVDKHKEYEEIFMGTPSEIEDVSDVLLITHPSCLCGFGLKDCYFYVNLMTGEYDVDDYKKVLRPDKKTIFLTLTDGRSRGESRLGKDAFGGTYLEYNKEHDVLVCYTCELPAYKAKKHEPMMWENFECVCVIERNGTAVVPDKTLSFRLVPLDSMLDICQSDKFGPEESDGVPCIEVHGKEREKRKKLIKWFFHDLEAFPTSRKYCYDVMGQSISHFFYSLTNADVPAWYYRRKDVEKYMAYELPELPDASVFGNKTYYYMDVAVIQHVKENLSVIRILHVYKKDCGDNLYYQENVRIFFSYGKPFICSRYYNGWYAEEVPEEWEGGHVYLAGYDEEAVKGTCLEGFAQMPSIQKTLDTCEDSMEFPHYQTYIFNDVYSLLVNQYTEGIAKSKLENIKRYITRELVHTGDFYEAIMPLFGLSKYERTHGTNIIKDAGIPVHMAETVDELFGKYQDEVNDLGVHYKLIENTITSFKYIFSTCMSYFKSMNKEQFKELATMRVEKAEKGFANFRVGESEVILEKLVSMLGPKNIKSYMEYVFDELMESDTHFFNLYYDYITICGDLRDAYNEDVTPRWKVRNVEELQMLHQELLTFMNCIIEENEQEELNEIDEVNTIKMEKVSKNWKKLCYKEDGFEVIAPAKASDIAREGIALNHCVKSYIDDVMSGRTTILFIRKTDDIEKPFYTLEVRNNRIRQCHGFNNCNVSKVEGLNDFILRYCKEKNVEYANMDYALAV